MREILFRGKRTDNGEWIAGKGAFVDYNTALIFVPDYDESTNAYSIDDYDVIPETIGQYTGLTDKNGKKIFEGDIVKTKFGRLCIVVWYSSPAHCGWDLKPIDTANNIVRTKPPTAMDLYCSDNLEIIGNVHDNPEEMEERF